MALNGGQQVGRSRFTQSGAGTITRDANAKMAELPSVFDWNGVNGTGAYDDSAGINAALLAMKAAGGGILHFPKPPVKYHCAGPIGGGVNNLANVTLWGSSKASIIEFAVGAAAGLVAIGWGGCAIAGLNFTGVAGQNGQIVDLENCTNTRVSDCWVSGAQAYAAPGCAGVLLQGCTDCDLEDLRCFGNGIGSDAAQVSLDVLVNLSCTKINVRRSKMRSTLVMINFGVQNSTWVSIEDFAVSGAVTNPAHDTYGYGIMFYGSAGVTPCQNCRVLRGSVENTAGDGVYLQTALDTEVGHVRMKNVCTDIHTGAIAEGGVAANIFCADLSIHHIAIDTCGRSGIRTDAPRTHIHDCDLITNCADAAVGVGDGGAVDSTIENITFSNCDNGIRALFPGMNLRRLTVTNVTGTTSKVVGAGVGGSGVSFDSVHESIFSKLQMSQHGGFGVNVVGDDNQVEGIESIDNSQSGVSAYDGVNLGGTNGSFRGITSRNQASNKQDYGVRLAGSGHTLKDCQLKGNVKPAGYIDTGASNTKRGNRLNTGPSQWTAVLVGGTVAIATNEAQAGDVVNITRTIAGGGLGHLSAVVIAGTITINSSSGTDTSTVSWELVH